MPASETLTELQSCIDISNIPTRFGGHFEYDPGMPINVDARIRERLKWSKGFDEISKGPLKWTDSKGVSAIETVGQIGGQARRQRIAVLRTCGTKNRKSN